MAANPTRAVRLVSIGEVPDTNKWGNEQVDAYRIIEKAAILLRATPAAIRRNASLEASARIFAHQNFR